MAWCFRDHQPWICFCGLFGPFYQGKSSLSTSEILSEGTVLILFKCEDFISIILIQYSWWFMMWYHQDSGSSRGTFSWQNHSPIWHFFTRANFSNQQIDRSIATAIRPSWAWLFYPTRRGWQIQPSKNRGFSTSDFWTIQTVNKSTVLSRYMHTLSIHRIHIPHPPKKFLEVLLLGMNRRDCSHTDHSTSSTSLWPRRSHWP